MLMQLWLNSSFKIKNIFFFFLTHIISYVLKVISVNIPGITWFGAMPPMQVCVWGGGGEGGTGGLVGISCLPFF